MFRRSIIKRRKSNRLKDYNYSSDGYYFVTICVHKRAEILGKINNDKLILSKYGKIVNYFWSQIPEHYSNVLIDEYVIMPNHVHGIVVINNNQSNVGAEHCSAPTLDCAENKRSNYGLLSKVIKSFKEICVKSIKKEFKDHEFRWQKSFYDHIIRNEESLNKIREYIIYNPTK